ncbi:flagellar P-ring protein precursor [mine drainage metagenome]|uniref:Flagellar P-ring protein n=1 Tax=mine drainage metagenome TaxID=410659 RepID=A0A1J5RB92_9ZZZZ
MSGIQKTFMAVLLILAALLVMDSARAERIKDLASMAGVRNNQLIGYGLVVGLDGSGDQTTQTPFTVQSIINMLTGMGVNLPPGTSLQLKNVAAVMVTANLPPFARPGQQIDITVSSMGNAKSLSGGTLVMTPLKGADGAVYAMAQGNVVVSGAGASSGGSRVVVNHLSVGRIAGGATVERAVPTSLGEGNYVYFDLNSTDFGTMENMVQAINRVVPGAATATDGRQVRIRAPDNVSDRVGFLSRIENIEVRTDPSAAKVIINARTGSVVMNQAVTLDDCAVAHGNLSVTVGTENTVSQPNPLSGGQTVVVPTTQISVKQEAGALLSVRGGVNLADVVKALNAIGANPQDLIAILQAMKSAGALHAQLQII